MGDAADSPSLPTATTPAPLRVLVVDPQADCAHVLMRAMPTRPIQVTHRSTLQAARKHLQRHETDLILLDPDLPDGSGWTLARRVEPLGQTGRMIVMIEQPSLEQAIEAIRLGVGDLMVKPIQPTDLAQCVARVLRRQNRRQLHRRHMGRLRSRCQQLQQAHHQIARQVDVLCQDLVVAYQELAAQMQKVLEQSDLERELVAELDLESILRTTLEHLLDQTGPTSAAIFLPSQADEYTIGGYVQYEGQPEQSRDDLQLLGDLVVPRVADQTRPTHLTDPDMIATWLGDDAGSLLNCELVGIACMHRKETLAVILLYRDRSKPFDPQTLQRADRVGPILAQALARSIRIHHRHRPM